MRRIFAEYAAGKSYRDIIAGLNRDGLKTKRGNPFGSNSLHDLLHNEKYIGTLVYGQSPYREDGTRNTHSKDGNALRIEGVIPAIVDKDLFDKVQEKMKANKRQQGGRPPQNREYPLKGRVFCASCKSAMTISISQWKYYYYKCNQKKRRHDCDAANISADVLERTVAETVRDALRNRENAEKLIRILREQSSVIQSSAVTQLQALIAEEKDVIRKLDNATNAVLSGLSSPTILAKIQELEHRKTEISAQMRTLKASVDASAIPENRLREIIGKFTAAEYTDLSVYLSIVYRVEVGKDAITIWTILDANPDGTYDFDSNGVLLTPGVPSGVPRIIRTLSQQEKGSDYFHNTPARRDTASLRAVTFKPDKPLRSLFYPLLYRVGDPGDEFAVGGFSLVRTDGVAKVPAQHLPVPTGPGHFDEVAYGPLHPGGGGVKVCRHLGVQAEGDVMDVRPVLHHQQDGLDHIRMAHQMVRGSQFQQNFPDQFLRILRPGGGAPGLHHTAKLLPQPGAVVLRLRGTQPHQGV